MAQYNKAMALLILCGIVVLLVTLSGVMISILGRPVGINPQYTPSRHPLPSPTLGSMDLVAAAGTATAVAKASGITPVPSATLLPEMREWQPTSGDNFALRLIYDSTRWARTDANTLASLRITGCTLRQAGGRSLGPGWSTEESNFATETSSFFTVLAKYENAPKFKTYSVLPDGPVFEIASDAEFEQCMQDGESVLKSIHRP